MYKMRSLIILLGVICILPCAVFELQCIQCFQKNSDSCDGPSVTCGADATSCIALSEWYYVQEDMYHTMKKDCNNLYPCGKTLYASNNGAEGLKAHIDCCEGNNCNTFNYNMPPDSGELKGKFCVGCFSKSLTECANKRIVQCKEEDDECYHYIGTIKDPGGKVINATFQGCLSKEGCALGFKSMVGVTEINNVLFECTKPKDSYY